MRLKKNIEKSKFCLLAVLLITLSLCFTACGSKKHELRTGPTITPAPTLSPEEIASKEAAEKEENSLGLSDDEIVSVLKSAIKRMSDSYSEELNYKPDENHSELKKYSDGSSDVIVTDDDGNETARLMYNEKHEMIRAVLNNFKDGKAVSGAVYINEKLASYFEEKEANGFFRLELEINGNEIIGSVSVSKGKTKTYIFDENRELLRISE